MAKRPSRAQRPDPEMVVRVLPTRPRENDCAIWSLSVLTGIAYEDVLLAAAKVDTRAGANGLWFGQLVRIARLLGVTLRRKRRADLETDTGILSLYLDGRYGHAAVLKQGQIIDVDSTVWDAEAYLAAKQAIYDEILILLRETGRTIRHP